MQYDNRNIVLNELIGLKVRIVKSSDKKQAGLSGRIIDETKNTFLVETPKGMKSIMKKLSTFRFYTQDGSFVVEGKEINFRPYERIEKGMKFYRRRRL